MLHFAQPAAAIDNYFDNQTGNGLYTDALNWSIVASPNTPPRSGGSPARNERAVIGTDNPSGLTTAAATYGTTTVQPAGLALGIREFDFDDNCPDTNYCNPDPTPGSLRGSLTITGGTLTMDDSADPVQRSIGADGRILVGVEGRGYLTMTGGTLNGYALIVAGENPPPGDMNGTSLVDLRGTSTFQITNPTDGAAAATARFGRRLRVEGPNVNFNADGNIFFESSNQYTAVITSPTAHSPITTDGTAFLGGSLFVEFSGAGASTPHTPGQTWNLVDAAVAIPTANNFNNIGADGSVQVSGITLPASDSGLAYRLKRTINPGNNHRLVQLSLERLLVLEVDRTTGNLKITNPHNGPISIDSYTVSSPLGSLISSYHGISGTTPTPPDPFWVKLGATANNLTEVINNPNDDDDVFNLSSIGLTGVSLGTGFDPRAVADNVNNFGTHGEDLTFLYSAPGLGIVRGQVKYVNGERFNNDLVLRVNKNTGAARLWNDSEETLVIDGFSLLSTTNSLNGTGFTAIPGGTGTWLLDATPDGSALSQVNFTGSRTLAPDEEVAIGNITNGAALSALAQAGLSVEFILRQSLEPAEGAIGDYNNDGNVDAGDYVRWRNNLGGAATLLDNRDPNNMATTVGLSHYADWKAHYGESGGTSGPEDTYRVGTVVFYDSLGAGGGGLAAPEPGTAVLFLLSAGLALTVSRRRDPRRRTSMDNLVTNQEPGHVGAQTMTRRLAVCGCAVVAVATAIVWASPAAAVTGGIPLNNFDFELPGPVGTKTVAFEPDGDVIPGIIPGWTFTGGMGGVGEVTGKGNENFTGVLGDSGTEGDGVPGNKLLLSTNDGRVYQVAPGSSIVNPPVNQQYKLGFDAFEVFTVGTGEGLIPQLTARFFYGAYPGTTFSTLVVQPQALAHYELIIGRNDPIFTMFPGAIGQTLGVEFDVTSREFNANITNSWIGIDNVVFEITGVLPGDLNGDGSVNSTDGAILAGNMQASTPFEANGELTGDNRVNLNDFRVLKNLLGTGGAGGGGLAGGGIASSQGVPEPSALLLAVVAFAALLGICRPNRSLLMRLSCVAVACGMLSAAARPAAAVLLAYEPFNIPPYTVGALEGQSSPSSYFSGPWTLGQAGQVIQSNSLEYGSFSGGSVIANAASRVGISLAEPWTTSKTGTYYISWVSDYGTAQDPNTTDPGTLGFRAVEFLGTNTSGIGEGRIAEVGFQGYGPEGQIPSVQRLGWKPGPGNTGRQFLSDLVFNDFAGPHLIVLKLVLTDTGSTPGDTLSIFLDPTSNVEPEVPTASAGNVNWTLRAITTNSLFFSDIGLPFIRPAFDELRIATTFAEALPVLPVAGDTNNDHIVDITDYNNIAMYMNQSTTGITFPPGVNPDIADANATPLKKDGRVTIADYRVWRDNYDPPPGSGGLTFGVPEPASVVLALAIVLAGLVLPRRTR